MTRKITAHLFSSVDGAVDAPYRFQFDSFDEGAGRAMDRNLQGVEAFLMGRVLYEEWSDYWPKNDDLDEFGGFINPLPKYVVSATLQEPLAWQNSTLLHGHEDVQRLELVDSEVTEKGNLLLTYRPRARH